MSSALFVVLMRGIADNEDDTKKRLDAKGQSYCKSFKVKQCDVDMQTNEYKSLPEYGTTRL